MIGSWESIGDLSEPVIFGLHGSYVALAEKVDWRYEIIRYPSLSILESQ